MGFKNPMGIVGNSRDFIEFDCITVLKYVKNTYFNFLNFLILNFVFIKNEIQSHSKSYKPKHTSKIPNLLKSKSFH